MNLSRKHDSWAYYCDECLEEIRIEEREKIKKFILGLSFYHPLKEGGEICPEENIDRREVIKFLESLNSF